MSHFAFSQCSPYQVFVTSSDVSCNGYNDGSAFVNSMGGVAPYQYFWQGSNGFFSNDSSINNLSPGTYQLTVVDSNNCPSITTLLTINEPIFDIFLSSSNVSCYGYNNGQINVNIIGGIPPFTYQWNPPNVNSSIITNLSPNIYSVSVIDDNFCVLEDSVTITQPDSLNLYLDSLIDVSCYDTSDGYIKVNYTGGFPSVTFLWVGQLNNNQSYVASGPSKGRSNLFAGVYTITATDQNSCQSVISVVLNEPSALNLNSVVENVSCNGFDDANISIASLGGTSPFSYLWSNLETTSVIDSLVPNTYSVVVTDENNCTYQEIFSITEPSSLSISSSQNNVSCFANSDASINLNVNGGTIPYSYLWTNGSTSSFNNSLIANAYEVVVTDDNNCIITDSFIISEPLELILQMDSIIDVNCFGGNNSFISVSSYGGIGLHNFSWSDSVSTSFFRDDLYSGNYTVSVSDSNNCITSLPFQIAEPNEIQIQYDALPNICYNDSTASINVTNVSGGIGTYSYLWSNAADSLQLQNLYQDTLSLLVYDSVNCIKEFNISIPQTDSLSVAFTIIDVSCSSFSDGSISVSTTGGTFPFSYTWNTSDTNSILLNQFSGSYTVNVTDSNNCFISASANISSPNPLLTISTINNPLSCFAENDGFLSVSSTGGTPPYNYAWSNGWIGPSQDSLPSGNYSVITTDANSCFVSNTYAISEPDLLQYFVQNQPTSCYSSSDGIINISVSGGTPPYSHIWSNGNSGAAITTFAGIYTDTITDVNSCQIIVTDTILQPSEITLSSQINNVSCNGGTDASISVNVVGGTPSYSYFWNGNLGSNTIFSLSQGLYYLSVSDGNNCNILDTFTVSEPIDALQSSFITQNVSCYSYSDGEVDLSVSGGTSPYSFLWSNSDTTEDVTSLSEGNYSVIVTDGNNCSETFFSEIYSPDSLTISLSTIDISCFGDNDGRANVNVSGGNPPYTYLWGNGSVLSQTSQLSSQSHSIFITDSTNCVSIKNFIINEPSLLVVNIDTEDISCFDNDDGQADVMVSGGVSPYSYLWTHGDTIQNLQNLSDGVYTINVTDSNNCTSLGIGIVNEPSALNASKSVVDISCFGLEDGSINIQISGGTPPFNFLWNNGNDSEDLLFVPVGFYTVEITDFNNCNLIISDSISQPYAIYINEIITSESCWGEEDGVIDVTVNGGEGPYLFDWSNGENTEDIYSLASNIYFLSVMDNNFCVEEKEFEVLTENDCINIPNVFTPNGDGVNDTWVIRNIESYQNISILVVNENGEVLFNSTSKSLFWDGTLNGNNVESGTYYYYISLDNELFTGSISIVK